MSTIARQTAVAFGDEPDRDVEAEFGATVAPKVSASAKVGPVLPGAAAPAAKAAGITGVSNAFSAATKSVVAQLSTKSPATVKVSTAAKAPAVKVTASPAAVKAPAVPAPKPTTTAKPAPAPKPPAAAVPAPKPTTSAKPTGNATTAQTGNFLDGGGAPLAAPNVKDPRSDAQKAADAQKLVKLKASEIRATAQKTANANAKYVAERNAEIKRHNEYVKRMQTEDSQEAREWRAREKFIASAGTDFSQLLAGGAVIATGAAAIATGGAIAGALAVPSVAGVTGAAVAADRLIASAEKAKLAPSGASSVSAKAKAVLDTTAKLAAAGVPDAVNGARAIAEAAKERVLNGALPGVPQALTPAGKKALDGFVDTASPAVQAALATPTPNGYSTTVLSARPAPALKTRTVAWFVSTTGKVTRGDVLLGKGFRVYSDGAVVKQ